MLARAPNIKDAILDLWAESKSAGAIAKDLRLKSRNVVIGVVSRARAKGDPRAMLKFAGTETQMRAAAGRKGGRSFAYGADQPKSAPKPRTPRPVESKPRRSVLRLIANFDAAHVGPSSVTVATVKSWQCRYPVRGSGADMLMCGVRCGSPTHAYCEGHRAIAYRASSLREGNGG